jgi:hypothetical protein
MPENSSAHPGTVPPSAARTAAVLLVAAPVLEIIGMAHHPTVRVRDIAQAVEEMRALATPAAWVHGILIALMLATFFALTEFARPRLARAVVRAGLIAYGVGVIAMTGAAVVDGFVTPGLAFATPVPGAQDLQITAQLMYFSMLCNRALASLGAVAMSCGIAAWSVDLLRGTSLARSLGVLGLLIAVACALALISGVLHLDVHGMSAVVVLQGIWTIGVAALLLQESRRA